MEFIHGLKTGILMALLEMRTHWLRSLLSMTGVMLGVSSLFVMLLLMGGIDVFLNQQMSKWAGSIWIWEQNKAPEEQKLAWSRSPGLRFSDGGYLEQTAPRVDSYRRQISRRGQVNWRMADKRVSLEGLDEQALREDREDIKIKSGRWFEQGEMEQGKKKTVLSWDVAAGLIREEKSKGKEGFKESDLINQEVVFENKVFQVIGIYEPIDPDAMPWRFRRSMIVPLETAKRYLAGVDGNPGNIEIRVNDPMAVKSRAEEAANYLIGRHRGAEDFSYHTSEWLNSITEMLGNVRLLMSFISVLSLTVGGLGIMTVMLSSINERIREIGTRKALGAKNLQIFVQFLSETITLSVTGGILGAGLGSFILLFKEPLRKSTQGAMVPTARLGDLLIITAVTVFVGIIFGLYPALKAAKLKPVEALRYE